MSLGLPLVALGLTDCHADHVEDFGSESTQLRNAPVEACITLQGSAVDDAMISNPPKHQNYGSHPLLRVGGKDESLIRFDLGAIPTEAAIDSATLKLYVNGDTGNNPIHIHRATSSWSEGTVSFESFNQQFAPGIEGIIQPTSPNALKSASVTGLVTQWLTGEQANFGMVLATTGNKPTIFVSNEGGTAEYRPALEVCYTLPVDDLCDPDPCQNGGTCSNGVDDYSCACPAGYEGTHCEVEIDECAGEPCANGDCLDVGSSYKCACDAGWTGANCDIDIDECSSDPCVNGICTNEINAYSCVCDAGFSGPNCEVDIDECLGAPCQNGGVCSDGQNGYSCACPAGFEGAHCELNTDDCLGSTCQNNSTCVDGIDTFSCACLPGFDGTHCENDIDECAGAPCLNGGGCTDGINGYECSCAAGYTGESCEIDIDECSPSPCVQGDCVDLVNNYSCTCLPGWTGPNCDTNEPGEPLPAAAALKLNFSASKRFDFGWAPALGATYYQLLERPTPDLPYAQIEGDIVGESVSLPMPLHLRFGASYILRACNSDGCTDSEPVDVVDSLATAVGYVKASNTQAYDRFGGLQVALSADGNTLAVGAVSEASAATGIGGDQANNAATGSGAVYVFVRVNNAWSQQAYVKASNTDANDGFGGSVSLSADGNTLAVGANFEDSAATGINGDQASNALANAGAVYVFTRANAAWSQQAYVKASNPGFADFFGSRVALSGDGETLAVSAAAEDSAAPGIDGDQANNALSGSGAVYVFVRANNAWSQQAYVKASNPGAEDNFGRELVLSADGDTLVACAEREDSSATTIDGDQANNDAQDSGAVYVFVRADDAWSQQAYVKATNAAAFDNFGFSVALAGDGNTLAVGAHREDSAASGVDGDQADNTVSEAGAVYVFARTNNAWSQQAYVKASNPGAVDWFGHRVGLSGDGKTLAVAAYREDSAATGIGGDQADNTATDSGAVYVFRRTNDAWSQRAYVKASNTGAADNFGSGIALSTDGSTLAVVGQREDSAAVGIGGDQANDAATEAGAVYLY